MNPIGAGRSLALAIVVGIFQGLSFAQSAKIEDGSGPARSASFKELSLHWMNTRQHPNGYLEVVTTPEFVGLLDAAETLIKQRFPVAARVPLQPCDAPTPFKQVGAMPEAPGRISVLFSGEGTRAMLTTWELAPEQSIEVPLEEFLNVTIDGVRGTLSLARSEPPGMRSLWKVTWMIGRINREFYLEDNLSSVALPDRSADDVVDLAQSIRCELPR